MFKRCLGSTFPVGRARVGVLGGSFNPAHSAHLALSEDAMRRLNLDHVLWAICQNNPNKKADEYLPLETRVSLAASMTRDKKILLGVSGQYAFETVADIRKNNPYYDLVWLMGDDSWMSLGSWYRWQHLRCSIPMVVFRRYHELYCVRGVAQASSGFAGVCTNFYPKRNGEWVVALNTMRHESSTVIRNSMRRFCE